MRTTMSPLSAILALTGGAPPIEVPPKVIVGTNDNPIRYTFTFDDSDPDAAAFDFTATAGMVDKRWVQKLTAATAKPKIYLYIERIELEWLDEAAAVLEDSQKWATVWDAQYLRLAEGEVEEHIPLPHCNRLFAEVAATQVGGGDSTDSILELKKPTRRCVPAYVGKVIDLHTIKTSTITWTAGVDDPLGADTGVNVWIYGGAWMHDAPGAEQAKTDLEQLCACKEDPKRHRAVLAELGKRAQIYEALRAR